MSLYIYIKKTRRVSAGFTRVARVPGRPAGSTGFHRANSRAGFCLHPDRSQARVGRVPGRPAGPVRVLKHWNEGKTIHKSNFGSFQIRTWSHRWNERTLIPSMHCMNFFESVLEESFNKLVLFLKEELHIIDLLVGRWFQGNVLRRINIVIIKIKISSRCRVNESNCNFYF
jgi:hypothetical protein